MFVQGKCYKCGGILAVDDKEDASVCPFCGKPFVVAKAIRNFGGKESPAATEEKYFYKPDKDFVVERSVLVRYNGFTKNEVRIPDGITVIGEAAFQGMNNIESIYIPDGVESINAAAFSGCKSLKSVRIPDGLEIVDRDAFNGCSGLVSVKLPDSVAAIEAGAFAGCTCLEEVNIPQEVEQLPWRIFEGCISLKKMTVPKKVKTIDDLAFAECVALEEINFEYEPAAGAVRIGMNAFRNCKSLSVLGLPQTLKYIGNEAFRGCSKLKQLAVPKSVKAVYPLAFADCTALEQVTIEDNTELYKGSNPYKYELSVATFYNCPKLLNVSYSDLQKHFWAFPAYTKAHEPENIANGKCRYCGGDFKGIFDKVCSICGSPKDY